MCQIKHRQVFHMDGGSIMYFIFQFNYTRGYEEYILMEFGFNMDFTHFLEFE